MKKNAPQQQEEPTAYFESAGEPTPLLWLPHSRKRAAKKAIVKEKPWRFAFWLDSGFQFTAKEAFALCRTLPESLRTIETVQTLEELIREAFSEQSHKKGKPSPAQITAQLQEL